MERDETATETTASSTAEKASSSGGLKKMIVSNLANFATGFSIFVFVVFVTYSVLKFKEKHYDYPRYELVEVQTGDGTIYTTTVNDFLQTLTAAAAERERGNQQVLAELDVYESRGGRSSTSFARSPMTVCRPRNPSNPFDVNGVIAISDRDSATLTVSTEGDYHEVVIYSYPSWESAYYETNINEVPFDFLPRGNYVVNVFSTSKVVTGVLECCRNSNRPKPETKSHRTTTLAVAEAREVAIEASVDALAPVGTSEILRVSATDTNVWPRPVCSVIKTVYTRVPPAATAIFLSVPSYGYVLEGSEEHLGQLVHEGSNYAIYRIVGQQLPESGGEDVGATSVSITVMYPDMNPTAVKVSPEVKLFFYGEENTD